MVGACNVENIKRYFFFSIEDHPGEVGSSRERDRVKWASDQHKDRKRKKVKTKVLLLSQKALPETANFVMKGT